MIAGWMTAESDSILTAPSRLIEVLSRYLPLRAFETPVKLDPIDVVGVWHARMNNDPAHNWLRESVVEALGASATATASASARDRTARKGRTKSR